MQTPVNTLLLALLLQAYNKEVKDFHYFPDVVLIGRQRIDPELFRQLLAAGYLRQTAADSFGRCYRLSAAAEQLLLAHRRKGAGQRKKQPAITVAQPSLDF